MSLTEGQRNRIEKALWNALDKGVAPPDVEQFCGEVIEMWIEDCAYEPEGAA